MPSQKFLRNTRPNGIIYPCATLWLSQFTAIASKLELSLCMTSQENATAANDINKIKKKKE